MFVVRAHVDVAGPRYSYGTLDTLPMAYPRSIVASRCSLELVAIYVRMGGNSSCDLRHGSTDVRCLYCNHCKLFCDEDLATALKLLGGSLFYADILPVDPSSPPREIPQYSRSCKKITSCNLCHYGIATGGCSNLCR